MNGIHMPCLQFVYTFFEIKLITFVVIVLICLSNFSLKKISKGISFSWCEEDRKCSRKLISIAIHPLVVINSFDHFRVPIRWKPFGGFLRD